MKITLLGGNGFIGANLTEALIAHGHTLTVFDRPGQPKIRDPNMVEKINWIEGDFLNVDDVRRALNGAEIVFHLVSTSIPKTSNENPGADVRQNVIGSINLMETASRCGVRRVIFISSGGTVYGNPAYLPIDEQHPTEPMSSYGIGKLMIEKYFALYSDLHGLDYAVLRLSNPFGVYQSSTALQGAIAVFLGRVLAGKSIEIWGDGSITRDYVYISDVVDAMCRVMAYDGGEKIFNIGSGEGKSLLEVIDAIGHVTGQKVDYRLLAARSFDVPANVLAINRAREELGWVPNVDFQDGLQRMFYRMKDHGDNE